MNKYDYKNICPFKWFVLENFPFIEDDFDALTNWQLFCKIGKEINKIIKSQNEVGQAVEDFTEKFIALYNYVHDYFDNLDVQEEINNKLDEMVEDGTLQDILKNYISTVKYIFPKNWEGPCGDACIIQAYDKNILIDTSSEANKNDLYEMLANYNISHIDYCILTHYHNDHVGNFINLVNDGYIDETTVIYLPGYYYLCENIAIYHTIHNFLELHPELITLNPVEGDVLSINDLFTITFYNCQAYIFDELFIGASWKDYNLCSTVLFVKHGSVKSVYTADAYGKALDRLYNLNYINTKIDLYKIEHHGINSGESALSKQFLNAIIPTYAVQISSLFESQKNNLAIGLVTAFLQGVNTRIFPSHKNTDYIEFTSAPDYIKNVSGKECFSVSSAILTTDVYVDSHTSNLIQNGTQNYPYKELSQCIGELNPKFRYTIHLADGDYNNSHEQPDKNISKISNFDYLEIVGNSSHRENVKIHNGFIINNSNVHVSYCTFYADNSNCITVTASRFICTSCTFNTTDETISPNTAIYSQECCDILLNDVTVSNVHNGLSTHNDKVVSRRCTFNNIDGYAIYLRMSTITEKNNSFINCTNKGVTYENSYPIANKKRKIFGGQYGGDVKTGDLQLTEPISKFNKIVVVTGYAGAGTIMNSIVMSYGNNTFQKNSAYSFASVNDIVKMTVDSEDDTLLHITRSNDNTGSQMGIRFIWGYYEEIE